MARNKVDRRRLVFVVLIIASLALLTVSFRQTDSGPVHAIRQAAISVFAPVQTVGAKVAKPFQDAYRWISTLWSAHQEVDRLRIELQALQGEAFKLREQTDENRRLRGLLDLKNGLEEKGIFPANTEFKVARVIGKSPTIWNAWVDIDKGSADGVQIDQAVIGATPSVSDAVIGKGLVGKVINVTKYSARVQLISDGESSVSAKIQDSRAEGFVEGSVSGQLVMNYVDRDIVVNPKQIIETSGFGGVYPPNIPIGIVSSVGEEDVNAYKRIEMDAFIDFLVLEEVMVVIVPTTPNTYSPNATSSTTSSSIITDSSTTTSSTDIDSSLTDSSSTTMRENINRTTTTRRSINTTTTRRNAGTTGTSATTTLVTVPTSTTTTTNITNNTTTTSAPNIITSSTTTIRTSTSTSE